MRTRTLALITASIALSAPAAARAADPVQFQTLAYATFPSPTALPQVWATSQGGAPVRVAKSGYGPVVSPRGDLIAYGMSPAKGQPRLLLSRPGGAFLRTLAKNVVTGTVAWSPDESLIATAVGPEIGKQSLVLITVADGKSRTVATGYFSGISFSPDGTQLTYGRTAKANQQGVGGDVFVAKVAGGTPAVNITKDNRSTSPLWGPDQIVFSRLRKPRRKNDYPKANLSVIQGDGSGRRTLTRLTVPYLLFDLTATAWSADGKHLLAEYGGQDYGEAWTVNVDTGKARDLTGKVDGVTGFGISANGNTVLAATGGFDPGSKHNLVTVPYGGGKVKVLVKKAYSGSWAGY